MTESSAGSKEPKYLRVAAEEAFAPPELIERYRKMLQSGPNLDRVSQINGNSMPEIRARALRS